MPRVHGCKRAVGGIQLVGCQINLFGSLGFGRMGQGMDFLEFFNTDLRVNLCRIQLYMPSMAWIKRMSAPFSNIKVAIG